MIELNTGLGWLAGRLYQLAGLHSHMPHAAFRNAVKASATEVWDELTNDEQAVCADRVKTATCGKAKTLRGLANYANDQVMLATLFFTVKNLIDDAGDVFSYVNHAMYTCEGWAGSGMSPLSYVLDTTIPFDGEKLKMSKLEKATAVDVVVGVAKRLAEAEKESLGEWGLTSEATPREMSDKAFEIVMAAADDEVKKVLKPLADMIGEAIFETSVTSDVEEVVSAIMGGGVVAKSEEMKEVKPAEVVVKPAFEQALSAILNSATDGVVKNAAEVVATYKKVVELASEMDTLRASMASMAVAAPVTPPETIGEDGAALVCTTKREDAAKLFKGPGGKASKALSFPVPTFEWSGKHKDVPKIDETYQFRVVHLLALLQALAKGKNVWMYGHTGTGKSTLLAQVAARLGWPVTRINLDSGIERTDLLGKTELVLEDGKQVTKFIDGIVVKAMRQGHILLLDEVDFGRSDVMYALQRILEGNGVQLMEGEHRELVVPHPNFRVVATANTKGQGDEHGMYQGAGVQSEAFRDRFTIWLEIDYLPEDQEKQVLKAGVPSLKDEVVAKMVQFANEIRASFKKGQILQTLSPRSLVEMGESYSFLSSVMPSESAAMMLALELTTVNKAATDSQQTVREIAKRVFA